MTEGEGGLQPRPGWLPQQMERLRRPGLDFDVIEYPNLIDSSAIRLAHWNMIIRDIAAGYDAYDGFVVIHGTDTMAYTASALAFSLPGLGKPVILTGSQLPLSHPRSDGWGNLADALEAACQSDLHEVALAFDRLLLRGCRARKLDVEAFRGFGSPNYPPLAEFAISPRWHRQRWLKAGVPWAPRLLDESVRVAAFFLTPGISAALIGEMLADARLDGALLLGYGCGNAPDDPALLAGVAAASAAGCPVLTLTQATHGAVAVGAYAASAALARAGAIAAGDMTPEAALAKLSVLCGQEPGVWQSGLKTSLAGEMSLSWLPKK